MRLIARLLIAVCTALAAIHPDAAWAERRIALSVGIDVYEKLPKDKQLLTAANDARAMAAALRDLGFETELQENVDKLTFVRAWQKFLNRLEPGDTAVLFFAGHGVEIGGLNYLLPGDVPSAVPGEDRVLAAASVRFNELMDELRDKKVRVALFIVDACRDNPFRDATGQRSVGRARGLGRVEAAEGSFAMFSAGIGEKAWDQLPGEAANPNSVYTRALLPLLKSPGLSLPEIATRVREQVVETARKAGQKQTPAYYDQLIGRFVLKAGVAVETEETTMRVCREVAVMSSLSVLGALADQYKGKPAGRCIAARIAELGKTTDRETKVAVAPPKLPDPAPASGAAPVTDCDRLAAPPTAAPAGVQGVHFVDLNPIRAVAACREAVASYPGEVRFQSWLGRTLIKAESYEEARSWFEKAVEKGEPVAMTNLGQLYLYGNGVPQDYAKARSWFEKGAEKGEPVAMNELAFLYHEGKGVSQDDAKARSWLEKAAQKGASAAMTNLGQLYRDGKGVPRDYAKARSWYERAAEKGEPGAMSRLGYLHLEGKGVPQDYAKARAWFERAAEKGDAAAISNLGWLYDLGKGVSQDYAKARSWYEKAAEKGDAAAMRNLASLYARGEGVARSPQTAARHLLAAARADEATARADLDGDMVPWAEDTRRAVQELLATSGDYSGRVDGQWGPSSRDAARAYYLRKQRQQGGLGRSP